jgi:hypothetical protein
MAFPKTQWYVNSVGYAAVLAFATAHTYTAGNLIRQLTAPTVGNERVFVCIVGGLSVAEPLWTVTRGAKNTSTTPVFQECTGQAGVNGDIVNTPAWLSVKNTVVTLGPVIKDAAGTHLFILSTAGTAGSGAEPTWNTAAVGNTTADNTCTWTYIGLASSFSGASAPHAFVSNALALTWSQAGETICVGDSHAGSTTALNWGGQSTTALPNYILCHNHTGNYPPQSGDLTTGATETATAGAFNFNMLNCYVRGVGANVTGTGAATFGNAQAALQRFELSPITLSGASATVSIGSGSFLRGCKVIHDNCTIGFNNTAQVINMSAAQWEWRNTASAIVGSTLPTNLINAGNAGEAWIHGVDLSALGSGKTLVNLSLTTPEAFVLLDRCKINASVTVASVGSLSSAVMLSKCSSGNINYRDELYIANATWTTETTIVRSGGASDGATAFSRKIVTGANLVWPLPFEAPAIEFWNETVGSPVTITLLGIWGGGTVPNNDDFWIDVRYPGSGSTPIESVATSGKADILASGTPLSSDASTWAAGSTTPFATSVTVTPQEKGVIRIIPKMAKVSTTLYYDPKVVVS